MLREASWLVLLFPNGPLAGGTLAGQLVGAHPGAALHHGFSVGRASGFKTQAGWLHFVPEGGLLFSPPMNSSSQPLGKAYLEDIFSGVVSTELGPIPGPKGTGEGKTTWTGLCSVAEL